MNEPTNISKNDVATKDDIKRLEDLITELSAKGDLRDQKIDASRDMLDVHRKILDEHSHKLDEHGHKLDEHGHKLDEHSHKLDEHGQMLQRLEKTQQTHSKAFEQLFRMINKLDAKIDAETQARKEDYSRIMNGIDKLLVKDMPQLQTEKIATTARLDRHDVQLANHEKRLDLLEMTKSA